MKYTYEKILEIAKKKQITVKQFDSFFKPFIKDDDTILFDEFSEAKFVAEKFYCKHNNTKPYQHIWTCVDGDSGKPILLNGTHACNRIAYVVCETPWGDGSDADKNLYLEAKY